ncbi:hypothetical protein AB205_0073780 [Aquarana catesbeiana]|uniref:Uncharacterized protein n=1 Tax=Aquarana catesbeiana TaxID=8400 RepID=A0A2G9QCJ6_AQUCT|nr:hypothetical protein AB205_0076490 [Aquarana catesbeiana]PIO13659.1 hypothetical protein AB205_0073780 [Aquarana catesbeiana]
MTLPSSFILLFLASNICVLSIPFFIHIGEKRLGSSEDTRDPQPPKEGEISTPQPEDMEEGEVYEVGEIVTTTGDVDVVKEDSHFTSASAHVLIGRSWCAIVIYKRSRKTSMMLKKDSKTSLMFWAKSKKHLKS